MRWQIILEKGYKSSYTISDLHETNSIIHYEYPRLKLSHSETIQLYVPRSCKTNRLMSYVGLRYFTTQKIDILYDIEAFKPYFLSPFPNDDKKY